MENQEMLNQMINNIEVMINDLIDKTEEIKKENKHLKDEINSKNQLYNDLCVEYTLLSNKINGSIPVKVYHHKKRENTTVKFLDGTSITVKRMKGDKDCLETAIVYALFKKNYADPNKLLKELVKNVEEVGEEKCKKS